MNWALKLAVSAYASSCTRFRVKTKTIKLINSLNQNPSSEAKLLIQLNSLPCMESGVWLLCSQSPNPLLSQIWQQKLSASVIILCTYIKQSLQICIPGKQSVSKILKSHVVICLYLLNRHNVLFTCNNNLLSHRNLNAKFSTEFLVSGFIVVLLC